MKYARVLLKSTTALSGPTMCPGSERAGCPSGVITDGPRCTPWCESLGDGSVFLAKTGSTRLRLGGLSIRHHGPTRPRSPWHCCWLMPPRPHWGLCDVRAPLATAPVYRSSARPVAPPPAPHESEASAHTDCLVSIFRLTVPCSHWQLPRNETQTGCQVPSVVKHLGPTDCRQQRRGRQGTNPRHRGQFPADRMRPVHALHPVSHLLDARIGDPSVARTARRRCRGKRHPS